MYNVIFATKNHVSLIFLISLSIKQSCPKIPLIVKKCSAELPRSEHFIKFKLTFTARGLHSFGPQRIHKHRLYFVINLLLFQFQLKRKSKILRGQEKIYVAPLIPMDEMINSLIFYNTPYFRRYSTFSIT